MAVVVWTDVPILLDPKICHAWCSNLGAYLPYNMDQVLCLIATAASDGLPAVRWRERPVVRPMASGPEISTLVQKRTVLNSKHHGLLRASYFFAGSSQRYCFLSVREVGV